MSARILWTVALLGSIACGCRAMHHHDRSAPMCCACCCDRGDHPRDDRMRPRGEEPREMHEAEENEDDERGESEESRRSVHGLTLEPGQSMHIEADSGGRTFTLPMNGSIEIQRGSGEENEEADEGENDESGEQGAIVLEQSAGSEPLHIQFSGGEAANQDPAERARLEEKIRRYLQAHYVKPTVGAEDKDGETATIVVQDDGKSAQAPHPSELERLRDELRSLRDELRELKQMLRDVRAKSGERR